MVDVLVIGAGAAGVAAARAAHEAGASVCVVADGGGAAALGSGVVWGVARDPFVRWAAEGRAWRVGGRYVTTAGWLLEGAVGALSSLLDLSSLPAHGTPGVLAIPGHPAWSATLVAQSLGARVVEAPTGSVEGATLREVAARLDLDGAAEAFAHALAPRCEGLSALLLPPVLGLARGDVAERIAAVLRMPVGETAGVPGDAPGVRVTKALRAWLPPSVEVLRGRATVRPEGPSGVRLEGGRELRARSVVLCTGGLLGGGLAFGASLHEATAGAPVWTRDRRRVLVDGGSARGADPAEWFDEHTGRARGAGLRVDGRGRIAGADGTTPLAPWLHAAGEVCCAPHEGLADALADGARTGRCAAER